VVFQAIADPIAESTWFPPIFPAVDGRPPQTVTSRLNSTIHRVPNRTVAEHQHGFDDAVGKQPDKSAVSFRMPDIPSVRGDEVRP
jgi:hypothetical protein